MKKIIFAVALMSVACTKVQSVDVIENFRDIDTQTLIKYKSNLSERNISVGMMYNWGVESGAFLKNTPDSLDVVVLKEGFDVQNPYLKEDITSTKKQKATKVLFGADLQQMAKNYEQDRDAEIASLKNEKQKEWALSKERLTEAQKKQILTEIETQVTQKWSEWAEKELQNKATEIKTQITDFEFDGVSVEVPQAFNEGVSQTRVTEFLTALTEFAGQGKNLLFIVENPFQEGQEAIAKAHWVIHRNPKNKLLASFTNQAKQWGTSKYLPSVDFTEDALEEGFVDTPTFSLSGRLSRIFDVVNWAAPNRAGVAFYHIEKDYYSVQKNVTSKNLRKLIAKIQN